MQTPQKIAVVGSGLVGTLLAIYLKKHGHTVHVYDRSVDIRRNELVGAIARKRHILVHLSK